MKSFQEIYTEVQDISGEDSDAYLTRFKRWINDTQTIVLGSHSWKFLESTRDITTEASVGSYELDADVRKIISVITTDGTNDYRPSPVEDPIYWEYLQSLNVSASDVTEYYYQEGNDLLVWPDYATVSQTITVRYRKNVIDMSLANYTTGTIVSITNGAKALVGGSTVWTGRKPIRNQWIRVTPTSGNGDNRWYPIATIGADTSITLEKNYLGSTIAAGSSTYAIGEFPVIPSEHQSILIARPLAMYYDHIENTRMSERYWRQFDGGYEIGMTRKPGGMLARFIEEQAGMLDAKYFPPQGSREPISAEDRARNTTSVLG